MSFHGHSYRIFLEISNNLYALRIRAKDVSKQILIFNMFLRGLKNGNIIL